MLGYMESCENRYERQQMERPPRTTQLETGNSRSLIFPTPIPMTTASKPQTWRTETLNRDNSVDAGVYSGSLHHPFFHTHMFQVAYARHLHPLFVVNHVRSRPKDKGYSHLRDLAGSTSGLPPRPLRPTAQLPPPDRSYPEPKAPCKKAVLSAVDGSVSSPPPCPLPQSVTLTWLLLVTLSEDEATPLPILERFALVIWCWDEEARVVLLRLLARCNESISPMLLPMLPPSCSVTTNEEESRCPWERDGAFPNPIPKPPSPPLLFTLCQLALWLDSHSSDEPEHIMILKQPCELGQHAMFLQVLGSARLSACLQALIGEL
ncbi:hypothetical protein BKA70DRAFT_1507007 [Coprinopsis sp. MPI-PUGE-AT-0042]|nr:hypothetical protein BKA70DRAFT_1507007 [Coprinopsis sp. MPI-PUGE-AT-0042]